MRFKGEYACKIDIDFEIDVKPNEVFNLKKIFTEYVEEELKPDLEDFIKEEEGIVNVNIASNQIDIHIEAPERDAP